MIRAFCLASIEAHPFLNLKERWLVAINTANAALIGRFK